MPNWCWLDKVMIFTDMQLYGKGGIELAVLPIGDLFTMGPDDALEAVKLIGPDRVVPNHYNTWPPIEQDAQAWPAVFTLVARNARLQKRGPSTPPPHGEVATKRGVDVCHGAIELQSSSE